VNYSDPGQEFGFEHLLRIFSLALPPPKSDPDQVRPIGIDDSHRRGRRRGQTAAGIQNHLIRIELAVSSFMYKNL